MKTETVRYELIDYATGRKIAVFDRLVDAIREQEADGAIARKTRRVPYLGHSIRRTDGMEGQISEFSAAWREYYATK